MDRGSSAERRAAELTEACHVCEASGATAAAIAFAPCRRCAAAGSPPSSGARGVPRDGRCTRWTVALRVRRDARASRCRPPT